MLLEEVESAIFSKSSSLDSRKAGGWKARHTTVVVGVTMAIEGGVIDDIRRGRRGTSEGGSNYIGKRGNIVAMQ
jgi:hypothetical protein